MTTRSESAGVRVSGSPQGSASRAAGGRPGPRAAEAGSGPSPAGGTAGTGPAPAETYHATVDPESRRLAADGQRLANWKRWGPYLSERQWGTVREDYSADGNCWSYFPHDHARSRAYRWGEDGLLGVCDREGRLCLALALWNERDPILKERLFGLTGPEGNCGEDVKEHYFYLDSTPTHSHMRALYKYPQAEYPYARLVQGARGRPRDQGEYELTDTGVFDDGAYWDVFAEYAKAGENDLCVIVTLANRASAAATIHVLPTLWFRNTWSWGRTQEACPGKPSMTREGPHRVRASHPTLGEMVWSVDPSVQEGGAESARAGGKGVLAWSGPTLLFTENDTNTQRLYGQPNAQPYVKDAFHRYVVGGEREAVNPAGTGTKAAAHYVVTVPGGGSATIRLRLTGVGRGGAARGGATAAGATTAGATTSAGVGSGAAAGEAPFGPGFARTFELRRSEADAFYAQAMPRSLPADARLVARQAYAGLLWSKQFFYYVVEDWLRGDPGQIPPPAERQRGRNHDWLHLFNRDVISMPDKWEYPWYAAWDLAFHMIAFAQIDPAFAKEQLLLFLREWYMHPSGAIPAYEFAFSDVNPPVHAWACWRVYKITAPPGHRDRLFLERAFQKLLINFTWWVNRKDPEGRNVFGGGFLGLDNIGVFDRSRPLPTGGTLAQADGTAWMAFYCGTMLSIALELALENPAYEDIASKFFEHFILITEAINTLGGHGLWDQRDGFYYDQLVLHGQGHPLRVRSLVGILPIMAVEAISQETLDRLPGFTKRMQWFLDNRPEVAGYTSYMVRDDRPDKHHRLLAIPTRERLESVLRYVLDETEFLSPFGVRSVSRVHREHPFIFRNNGEEYRVDYTPGESITGMFGGNSNWRGPIWFPLNYLLIESLERYHRFYGNAFTIECPTGSGKMMNLSAVGDEIRRRLNALFLKDPAGQRPCHRGDRLFQTDRHFADLLLFHEYFHADTGRGLGASHQTGWTALAGPLMADLYWRVDKEQQKGGGGGGGGAR